MKYVELLKIAMKKNISIHLEKVIDRVRNGEDVNMISEIEDIKAKFYPSEENLNTHELSRIEYE